MKIKQVDGFRPIVITIETEQESAMFKDILNSYMSIKAPMIGYEMAKEIRIFMNTREEEDNDY